MAHHRSRWTRRGWEVSCVSRQPCAWRGPGIWWGSWLGVHVLCSPLPLRLSRFIVCVRGREISCVAQGRDHSEACDVEVVGVAIALESGPEGTTRMHARVQGLDLGENKRGVGTTPLLD
jgi:hypothetical protein